MEYNPMNWILNNNQDIFDIKQKGNIVWLSFKNLSETGMVKDAFSTRLGGVSKGKFSNFNFSYSRGDDPKAVLENYRIMSEVLNVDINKMVVAYQTHTINVREVTSKDCGMGVTRERCFKDVDGLMTNIPGITLVTFYADCVPLYIVDPVNKAIALSHSGWRGTVKRMGKETLERMKEAYGTKAEDTVVCIGPSICSTCYEVGEDVADRFFESFDKKYYDMILTDKHADNRYQLNLWEANRIIFAEAGVRPENITVTNVCTHCNSDKLFSHRAQGEDRGNLAAFLCLK